MLGLVCGWVWVYVGADCGPYALKTCLLVCVVVVQRKDGPNRRRDGPSAVGGSSGKEVATGICSNTSDCWRPKLIRDSKSVMNKEEYLFYRISFHNESIWWNRSFTSLECVWYYPTRYFAEFARIRWAQKCVMYYNFPTVNSRVGRCDGSSLGSSNDMTGGASAWGPYTRGSVISPSWFCSKTNYLRNVILRQ